MSFLPYVGVLEYNRLFYAMLSVLEECLPKLTDQEIDLSSEDFKVRLREAMIEEIESIESKEKNFSYDEKEAGKISLLSLNDWGRMFCLKMDYSFLSPEEKIKRLAEKGIRFSTDFLGIRLSSSKEKILIDLIKERLEKEIKLIKQSANEGGY